MNALIMGERIKKVRRSLDLTQQEFADQIGSKRNTIATYEMGRTEPSAAVVSLVCTKFNVNETWFRTGEGEMFVPKPVDTLDELVQKLGLSDGDRVLIQKFLDLNSAERQAVLNYVLSVAAEYSNSAAQPTQAPAPISTAEEEARAEAAEYYREILEEKKQAARSQVLPSDTDGSPQKMA